MSDIHPHWQAEEETPVPVTVREHREVPVATQKVPLQISRRPAAFVGMALVIGVGFLFFRGVEGLTGQLAPSGGNEKVVRITSTGVVPSRLNVEHGQTITWINERETPESISSDTLCSDTGFCLRTSVLLPGQSDSFTITPDMQAGTYRYSSDTSDAITGEIVIVTQTVDDFADITSILDDDLFPNNARDVPLTDFGEPQQEDSSSLVASVNIPHNPYTVEGMREHPFDASGDPIPEAFGDSPETAAFRDSGGPLRQPETGSGIWAVSLLSIGALLWSTRSAFATTGN